MKPRWKLKQELTKLRRRRRRYGVAFFFVIVFGAIILALFLSDYARFFYDYNQIHHYYDNTRYVMARDTVQNIATIDVSLDDRFIVHSYQGTIPGAAFTALRQIMEQSDVKEAIIGEAHFSDGYYVPIVITYSEVCKLEAEVKDGGDVTIRRAPDSYHYTPTGILGCFHAFSLFFLQLGTRHTGWPMYIWLMIDSVLIMVSLIAMGARMDRKFRWIDSRIRHLEYQLKLPYGVTVVCHYSEMELEKSTPLADSGDKYDDTSEATSATSG